MVLDIVSYGHPTLRQRGVHIEAITPDLQRLAEDMVETMHAAQGIGLAAQQVARAIQMFVLDLRGVTDRPSTLEWQGQAVELDAHMPLVLINPVVKPIGPPETGPEGCLSFPEIFAEKITRPGSVEVTALNERSETVRFTCSGLLARAVQHEHDHLRGILFIDRMTAEEKRKWQPDLDALQTATKAALQSKR
jgi:peptide deformylase